MSLVAGMFHGVLEVQLKPKVQCVRSPDFQTADFLMVDLRLRDYRSKDF